MISNGYDNNIYILLNHPLVDEEVANSLIESLRKVHYPFDYYRISLWTIKGYVVPMMVEEPSVVAGACYCAKLVNQTGGFKTVSSERIMIGSIVFYGVMHT
ncbi:hypothetical protein ACVPOW_10945 [Staphylococcus aureus]